MIARGGQPPERPAPAARPTAAARVIDPGPRVVVDPGPRIVDQGDLQTLPPGDPALLAKAPAPAVAPSAASIEEPVENTLNTEEQNLPGSSGQFDDLPTPVKNVPALRDLGIDSQADFAEDTSKGGLPRGLSPNAHQVDAGQYLSDDDLETID